jgi:CheY-specific phosphatase CheX
MKEIIERIIKENNVARLDSDRIEIKWNDLDNMSDDIVREITNHITNLIK